MTDAASSPSPATGHRDPHLDDPEGSPEASLRTGAALELCDGFEGWRQDRGARWYTDIGYAMENVLRSHRYDYQQKGIKPDDPGWHACSCGTWQGYWSGFDGHVADHLRALLAPALELVRRAEAAAAARTIGGSSHEARVDAKALREALAYAPGHRG